LKCLHDSDLVFKRTTLAYSEVERMTWRLTQREG
jgi:hypothetical protein